jgi:hypothetical protein
MAYNFFRLAAILQGIAGRVRDGTATNENAATMATEVGRSRRPVGTGRSGPARVEPARSCSPLVGRLARADL